MPKLQKLFTLMEKVGPPTDNELKEIFATDIKYDHQTKKLNDPNQQILGDRDLNFLKDKYNSGDYNTVKNLITDEFFVADFKTDVHDHLAIKIEAARLLANKNAARLERIRNAAAGRAEAKLTNDMKTELEKLFHMTPAVLKEKAETNKVLKNYLKELTDHITAEKEATNHTIEIKGKQKFTVFKFTAAATVTTAVAARLLLEVREHISGCFFTSKDEKTHCKLRACLDDQNKNPHADDPIPRCVDGEVRKYYGLTGQNTFALLKTKFAAEPATVEKSRENSCKYSCICQNGNPDIPASFKINCSSLDGTVSSTNASIWNAMDEIADNIGYDLTVAKDALASVFHNAFYIVIAIAIALLAGLVFYFYKK
jgi:hypothetical protein